MKLEGNAGHLGEKALGGADAATDQGHMLYAQVVATVAVAAAISELAEAVRTSTRLLLTDGEG